MLLGEKRQGKGMRNSSPKVLIQFKNALQLFQVVHAERNKRNNDWVI